MKLVIFLTLLLAVTIAQYENDPTDGETNVYGTDVYWSSYDYQFSDYYYGEDGEYEEEWNPQTEIDDLWYQILEAKQVLSDGEVFNTIIQQVFGYFDKNQDEILEFSEIMKGLTEIAKWEDMPKPDREEIMNLYLQFDSNMDGNLDLEEVAVIVRYFFVEEIYELSENIALLEVWTSSVGSLSDDEWANMQSEEDANNKLDQLNDEVFTQFQQQWKLQRYVADIRELRQTAQEAFKYSDENADGALTYDEAYNFVTGAFGYFSLQQPTEEQLQMGWAMTQKDEDGNISKEVMMKEIQNFLYPALVDALSETVRNYIVTLAKIENLEESGMFGEFTAEPVEDEYFLGYEHGYSDCELQYNNSTVTYDNYDPTMNLLKRRKSGNPLLNSGKKLMKTKHFGKKAFLKNKV